MIKTNEKELKEFVKTNPNLQEIGLMITLLAIKLVGKIALYYKNKINKDV